MARFSSETKVGLFVLVGVVLIGSCTVILGGQDLFHFSFHENNFEIPVLRKIVKQGVYYFYDLSLGFVQPGDLFGDLFCRLVFIVPFGIVFICFSDVVHQWLHAAGLKHLHHHGGSGPRQTRYDCDHFTLLSYSNTFKF